MTHTPHIPTFTCASSGKLTNSTIEFYKDHGVLVLENYVSAKIISQLREKAYALSADISSGKISVLSPQNKTCWRQEQLEETTRQLCGFWEEDPRQIVDSPRLIKISHALHRIDPSFINFTHSSKLLQTLRALSLKHPRIVQSMIHFKPPRSSTAISWHQDATFIATTPCSTTGFWIALEDATLENGCLEVIAGGHREELSIQLIRKDTGDLSFKPLYQRKWKEDQTTSLPVKAGTLIILHGLLPHRSLDNISDKSRLSLTFHYFDLETKYADENWLPLSLLS